MRKRAVRVTVFTFLLAANIAAAFFLWDIQRRTVELITSEDSVAGRVERMTAQLPLSEPLSTATSHPDNSTNHGSIACRRCWISSTVT